MVVDRSYLRLTWGLWGSPSGLGRLFSNRYYRKNMDFLSDQIQITDQKKDPDNQITDIADLRSGQHKMAIKIAFNPYSTMTVTYSSWSRNRHIPDDHP